MTITPQPHDHVRQDLIRRRLHEYPLQDPAQFADPVADLAAAPGRYLLLERSTDGNGHFASVHHSPDAAAEYIDGQEYPDDWELVTLVDLDTGAAVDGSQGQVTTFQPAEGLTGRVRRLGVDLAAIAGELAAADEERLAEASEALDNALDDIDSAIRILESSE